MDSDNLEVKFDEKFTACPIKDRLSLLIMITTLLKFFSYCHRHQLVVVLIVSKKVFQVFLVFIFIYSIIYFILDTLIFHKSAKYLV